MPPPQAKLAAVEAQLHEAQAAEASARAEAAAAREALVAEQQQRRADAAEARQQQEAALAAARAAAAAETSTQRDAAAAAAREVGAAQEQVAFLRSQLQFALQESEQESVELQRQLAAAQAESSALAKRGAEQEALVMELSSTVQQQQTRLQVRPSSPSLFLAQIRGLLWRLLAWETRGTITTTS
jgi:chromosome segregation ATPase